MASLDEQIKNIMVVMRRLAEPNGLTTSDLEWGEEQVKALISDQVAKAKIDELEHIVSGSEYSADDFDWYEITLDEYKGTNYYSEVRHLTKEERIAELKDTLNGVNNNE